MANLKWKLLTVFTFLLMLHSNFSFTISTKEQLGCTMCTECDNPCQPPQLPPPPPPQPEVLCPPPPPPPSPPPPPPPPSATTKCPPPPQPPCNGCVPGPEGPKPQPYPPTWLNPPGVMGGGSIYGPPNDYFPGYKVPPRPSCGISGSVSLVHIVFTVCVFLASVYFCYQL